MMSAARRARSLTWRRARSSEVRCRSLIASATRSRVRRPAWLTWSSTAFSRRLAPCWVLAVSWPFQTTRRRSRLISSALWLIDCSAGLSSGTSRSPCAASLPWRRKAVSSDNIAWARQGGPA